MLLKILYQSIYDKPGFIIIYINSLNYVKQNFINSFPVISR